jgi:hypothetical protein
MVLKLHIWKPLEKFQQMLSESTAMQALMAAEDAETAAEKIAYGYAEDLEFDNAITAQQPKPFPRALVALEDFSSERQTDTSWSTVVVMTVLIQAPTLEEDVNKSLSERYVSFLQRVEGVSDNVRELAASGTRLNVTSIRTVLAPQREDIKESEGTQEIWTTILLVEAGG